MRKIKNFEVFESVDEIDPSKLNEIIDNLTKAISDISKHRDVIKNYAKELSSFQNKSDEKGNDQIDDAVLNLEEVHDDIDDVVSKIDNINTVLRSYSDNGREYMY